MSTALVTMTQGSNYLTCHVHAQGVHGFEARLLINGRLLAAQRFATPDMALACVEHWRETRQLRGWTDEGPLLALFDVQTNIRPQII